MKKVVLLLASVYCLSAVAMEPVDQEQPRVARLTDLVRQYIRTPQCATAILSNPTERVKLNQTPKDLLDLPVPYIKNVQWAQTVIKPLQSTDLDLGHAQAESTTCEQDHLLAAVRNKDTNALRVHRMSHSDQPLVKTACLIEDSAETDRNGFYKEQSLVTFLPTTLTSNPQLLVVPRMGKKRVSYIKDARTGHVVAVPEKVTQAYESLPSGYELYGIANNYAATVVGEPHRDKYIVSNMQYTHGTSPVTKTIALEDSASTTSFQFTADHSYVYANSSAYNQCGMWETTTGKKLLYINASAVSFNDSMTRCMSIERTRQLAPGTLPWKVTTYDTSNLHRILHPDNATVLAMVADVAINNIPDLKKRFTKDEQEKLFHHTQKRTSQPNVPCIIS